MSVYKEGYHAVELITKRSKQIFSDAADHGAPTKKGDEIWNAAKQLVDWYGVKGTRKEHKYASGQTVAHQVTLMDEWAVSDGRKTEAQATDLYVVTFTSCTSGACKGYDGFVMVYQAN